MLEFLLFFLAFFPAFAEVIPDYENPYSPIFMNKNVYSWTDKVKMTIIAPSWNTDRYLIDSIGGEESHPIKISTRDKFLTPYRFTETDVNSGIFTGDVILTGFLHDSNGDGKYDTNPRTFGNGPTSGFLEADRDSAITVSFEFADGVVITESSPISWNLGTIQFSEHIFHFNQTASIQVIDRDMNLDPEALDHLLIQISSDSDIAGLEIDAAETSKDSGKFTADISFSQNLPSSGNRLFSANGDSIYAKYDDHTLPKPYSTSDNLEIHTTAKLDSLIPSLARITSSEIKLSDNFGNELKSFSTNNQIQIVGIISNIQNFNQQFVYLFQIKDAHGAVVSLSWIKGEISSNHSLDVSQSWFPSKSGDYFVETFVWNSLTDPIPLSAPKTTSFFVE